MTHNPKCKFTPLGFETRWSRLAFLRCLRVNLPRWGLKLDPLIDDAFSRACVNLPRWGLKHNGNFRFASCQDV